MIARIIVGIALTALALGFLWFIGQVIYLGLVQFFKIHSREKYANADHRKQRGRTAPNRAIDK